MINLHETDCMTTTRKAGFDQIVHDGERLV